MCNYCGTVKNVTLSAFTEAIKKGESGQVLLKNTSEKSDVWESRCVWVINKNGSVENVYHGGRGRVRSDFFLNPQIAGQMRVPFSGEKQVASPVLVRGKVPTQDPTYLDLRQ